MLERRLLRERSTIVSISRGKPQDRPSQRRIRICPTARLQRQGTRLMSSDMKGASQTSANSEPYNLCGLSWRPGRVGGDGAGRHGCAAKLVLPPRLVPIKLLLGSVIDVVITTPDVTARHSCSIPCIDSRRPAGTHSWEASSHTAYAFDVCALPETRVRVGRI